HAFTAFEEALDTDLDWVRLHTRLLVRAREWESKGRDSSLLLRGRDLVEAESELAAGAGKEPSPTPLQNEYVLAGRRAAGRRQRTMAGGVGGALVVALALAGLAIVQWRTAVKNEHTARSRELAVAAQAQLDRDPELALLLSLRAEKSGRTVEADAALRQAL